MGDIKFSKANIKNICKEFNIKKKYFTNLDTGIKETINYFK